MVADFNRDGRLDVAVRTGDTAVMVMLGNGDGTLGQQASFDAGASGPIRLADWDGDGDRDLLVGRKLWRGRGDGTFQALGQGPGEEQDQVFAGDFDGDHRSDLLVWHWTEFAGSDEHWIHSGRGDGTFGPATRLFQATPYSMFEVAVESAHGHGADGVVHTIDSIHVHQLESTLHGNMSADPNRGSFADDRWQPKGLLTADLDGDGVDDDIANTAWPENASFGHGALVLPRRLVLPFYVFSVGDFNGDGRADLSGSRLVCGRGDFTFTDPVAFTAPGAPVGDLNGDGRTDLLGDHDGILTTYLSLP